MPTEHLNPAKSIIERLGGVDVVAEICGKDRTRVYRWMYPRKRGGTGGLIPQTEFHKLLDYAKRHGIRLRPGDFMAVGDAA
jgi:translation initiation factor IF-1